MYRGSSTRGILKQAPTWHSTVPHSKTSMACSKASGDHSPIPSHTICTPAPVSRLFRQLLDRCHTLTFHGRRTWIGVVPDALTRGAVQGRIERMPGVLATELPEIVIH